jgi:SAM-dependent methyltransferase
VTTRTDVRQSAHAYLGQPRDAVRETFERAFFSAELGRLLAEAPGGRVLDLGCADGLVRELGGARVDEYVGIDLHPPDAETEGKFFAHDLGEGLGPIGDESFDLYFASFGVASHLAPEQLERLCRDIAAHARPGSLVALEALGLFSLEWPSLWETPPGSRRTLPYRLAAETRVHPWAPSELEGIFADAGIASLRALDRSVQAGPKVGGGDYWPGLPPVRASLNDLLSGTAASVEALAAPLPPLPAHPAARVHHALVARRQELVGSERDLSPQALARAIWALDPSTGGGFGHGLLAVGRVE